MKLDRRQVLAGAGALAASSALPAVAADAPRRDIKKALKIGMVREGDTMLEKFTLLAELGFDGVELDSPSGLDHEMILAARDAVGLPIHGVVNSVHWSRPLTSDDPEIRAAGVAAMKTALREAKVYGATTVLLVPGVVNRAVPYHVAWQRAQESFREFLPVAEETGVRIAIENVWNEFLISPVEAAHFLDEIDHELVGWYLDCGNVMRYGWPEHWIAALGKRVFKLDIKEFSQQKMREEGLWKGFEVELMEGDNDWPRIMAALDAIEWKGWGTAEVPGGGRERLTFLAERMDSIFAS